MEGMILAAGMGTRLRPLTDHRPKALVEVGQHPLLELAIERLCNAGIEHIVVNVHHMADMITQYLSARHWPCRISISDERAQLLDTGGALKHAAHLFSGNDEVLIHNVDVLSTIDLQALVEKHRAEANLATLCMSRRTTNRPLAFDLQDQLVGRYDDAKHQVFYALAFSGVSIINPRLFDMLPADTHPYPIIDEYIRLRTAGERIGAYLHPADLWLDVGKPETLKLAEQWIVSSDK